MHLIFYAKIMSQNTNLSNFLISMMSYKSDDKVIFKRANIVNS